MPDFFLFAVRFSRYRPASER